ncbi:ABC transporter transmembrane domain-containing protein, partial [Clostridium sp.]|uniref:ABC transporter transmembrane domain-containing protein n=1 Tax=Clostridium sp. TaxID=1506 RepID=UPI003464128C
MKELLLKRKGRFILYLVACFIPVIEQMLVNVSMALLIGSVEKGSIEYFMKILIFSVVVILLGAIMYIISRFMRISYMRDTILEVRVKAFDKILKSSYKNFSKKSKDAYISNLINDINVFENTFFFKLINIIFSSGVYIFSTIFLLFLDYKFAIIITGISIILFFLSKAFENKTVKPIGHFLFGLTP